MHDLDLDAIEERARKATPGPWRVMLEPESDWCHGIASDVASIVVTDSGTYPPEIPDATFIAHARTDVPALVAEVRRLRAELERVHLELQYIPQHY